MNDETKLYHEADWAAKRWDWFNQGRIVEPKSFCQFWRTVVLYATVKWLLVLATFPMRPMFHRAVAVGEGLDAFEKRHKKGMARFGVGVVAFYVTACALIIFAALVSSWFWGLVSLGGAVVVAFAAYGYIKTGVLGLLWQAAVAAHHGICPPVKITRSS